MRKIVSSLLVLLCTLCSTMIVLANSDASGYETVQLSNGGTVQVVTQESVRAKVIEDLGKQGYTKEEIANVYGGAYSEDGQIVITITDDSILNKAEKLYGDDSKIQDKKIKKVKKVKYSEDDMQKVQAEISATMGNGNPFKIQNSGLTITENRIDVTVLNEDYSNLDDFAKDLAKEIKKNIDIKLSTSEIRNMLNVKGSDTYAGFTPTVGTTSGSKISTTYGTFYSLVYRYGVTSKLLLHDVITKIFSYFAVIS